MIEPFIPDDTIFDLSFLLCSDSGGGKTHFITTYLGGPILFYMIDKNGRKTVGKQIKKRPKNAPPISLVDMSSSDYTFSAIWNRMQKDAKAGLFEYMRENNGIVAFDSLTSANEKAMAEIMKLSSVTPSGPGKKNDNKKGMSQPLWGQLGNWITMLTSEMQDLPCASVCTVHLHSIFDKNQSLVALYPAVSGQLRQKLAKDFDETYLLERRAGKQIIYMNHRYGFQASSDVFDCDQLTDYNLNQLATAYRKGDFLAETDKKKKKK